MRRAANMAVSANDAFGKVGDAAGDIQGSIEDFLQGLIEDFRFDETLFGNGGNDFQHAGSGAGGRLGDSGPDAAAPFLRASNVVLDLGHSPNNAAEATGDVYATIGNLFWVAGNIGDDGLPGRSDDDTFVFKSGLGNDTTADSPAAANAGDDALELDRSIFADDEADHCSAIEVGEALAMTADGNALTLSNPAPASLVHQEDFLLL